VTPSTSGPSAFAAALALLAGRSLTTGELKRRLRCKGYAPEEIAEASGRLADLSLLDDRRTAATWAESAAHVRGLGPRRIREGLVKRLLPRDLAEQTVAELFSSGAEAPLARTVLEKWERTKGPADDAGRRHAAYAHLRGRGFSAAAARAALFNRLEIE
jgi:regulatory protein